MARFKITITTIVEYEVTPKNYPNCNTFEKMLEADIENAKDNPFLMIEMEGANTKVSGEILEE